MNILPVQMYNINNRLGIERPAFTGANVSHLSSLRHYTNLLNELLNVFKKPVEQRSAHLVHEIHPDSKALIPSRFSFAASDNANVTISKVFERDYNRSMQFLAVNVEKNNGEKRVVKIDLKNNRIITTSKDGTIIFFDNKVTYPDNTTLHRNGTFDFLRKYLSEAVETRTDIAERQIKTAEIKHKAPAVPKKVVTEEMLKQAADNARDFKVVGKTSTKKNMSAVKPVTASKVTGELTSKTKEQIFQFNKTLDDLISFNENIPFKQADYYTKEFGKVIVFNHNLIKFKNLGNENYTIRVSRNLQKLNNIIRLHISKDNKLIETITINDFSKLIKTKNVPVKYVIPPDKQFLTYSRSEIKKLKSDEKITYYISLMTDTINDYKKMVSAARSY